MNHPLHPILVHLPIGLWIAQFVCDLVFFATRSVAIAQTSFFLLIGGLVGAVLASVAGVADYVDIPARTLPFRIATAHLVLNAVTTVIYLVNLGARIESATGTLPDSVTGVQLALSAGGFAVLGISGYLGGKLVYDYGIGFRPALRDQPGGAPGLRDPSGEASPSERVA